MLKPLIYDTYTETRILPINHNMNRLATQVSALVLDITLPTLFISKQETLDLSSHPKEKINKSKNKTVVLN